MLWPAYGLPLREYEVQVIEYPEDKITDVFQPSGGAWHMVDGSKDSHIYRELLYWIYNYLVEVFGIRKNQVFKLNLMLLMLFFRAFPRIPTQYLFLKRPQLVPFKRHNSWKLRILSNWILRSCNPLSCEDGFLMAIHFGMFCSSRVFTKARRSTPIDAHWLASGFESHQMRTMIKLWSDGLFEESEPVRFFVFFVVCFFWGGFLYVYFFCSNVFWLRFSFLLPTSGIGSGRIFCRKARRERPAFNIWTPTSQDFKVESA